MPHEYVPWRLGRDFADLGGEPWASAQSQLSPIARTALEVNLLTEDNLPSYHREIDRAFGRDGAWGTWVNRWTAEEGRHAFCIRDYLLVTRGVDPDELERARMETMQTGYDSGDKSLLNVCAYVSFQELATRVSHRNTGRYTEDPIAEKLLTRVAKDENLHMVFYRNIVHGGPRARARARRCARSPTRSSTSRCRAAIIPGFARKAVQMAKAGIYDLRIHHDDVVTPLLRHWGVWSSRVSTPTARRPATSWPPPRRARRRGHALRGEARGAGGQARRTAERVIVASADLGRARRGRSAMDAGSTR